jgi:1-acyl-sn-glycerol-3-phosphate acyltransferase
MASIPYTVPLHICIQREILRPILRGLFHILSRVRITGLENIPKDRPYLIAINHVSLFEPPFVLAFWPKIPEAAGAVEIWERPGQNLLARLYGGIPVHRGEYDRQLVATLLSVLASGRALLLAPEGGRSHQLAMRRALPGVAYLADQAGVPVVPVGILGTVDDFLERALRGRRPTIEMHIGKSFTLPPIHGRGEERRASRQHNADLIMIHIAELLPPEYHGVYAEAMLDVQANCPGLHNGMTGADIAAPQQATLSTAQERG